MQTIQVDAPAGAEIRWCASVDAFALCAEKGGGRGPSLETSFFSFPFVFCFAEPSPPACHCSMFSGRGKTSCDQGRPRVARRYRGLDPIRH